MIFLNCVHKFLLVSNDSDHQGKKGRRKIEGLAMVLL